MKCLSPLLLAYEDRMKEKDELLQTTEVNCFRGLYLFPKLKTRLGALLLCTVVDSSDV